MGRRPQAGIDQIFAVQARAFERSLELTAEIYALVVKLAGALTGTASGRPQATDVLAAFDSVRALFEPNASRLDSATCESIESLLAYHRAFVGNGEAEEPEIVGALRSQLAATKRHLEVRFRERVGLK